MDILPSRILHFRSKDCVFNNDIYSMSLSESISCQPDEEIVIELGFASIPYSFFNIENNYNNVLDITESEIDGSNPVSYTVFLDTGNYSSTQMLSFLQTNLNTQSGLNGKNFTYTIAYDRFKNKATFNVSTANAKTTFNFATGPNVPVNCQELLGFIQEDVSFQTGVNLISNSTINVSPYEACYIRTQSLGIVSAYETKNKGISTIFAKVPISSVPFSFIQYTNDQRLSYISTRQNIDFFEFQITDLDGAPLNLNFNNWTMSIVFQIRKKNDVFIPVRPNEMIPIQTEQ
jgi:hypothetical protein